MQAIMLPSWPIVWLECTLPRCSQGLERFPFGLLVLGKTTLLGGQRAPFAAPAHAAQKFPYSEPMAGRTRGSANVGLAA
jgi:hypothetical protein